MKNNCEIILDSKIQNERITCFRVTYPRIVHSEFMRHRSGSYCSASSRAIPLDRMIDQYYGFVPDKWRKHQSGMQPNEDHSFTDLELQFFKFQYEKIMNDTMIKALKLHDKGRGLAKEQVNRLLEPYSFITHLVQMSESGFKNLFELRTHTTAQYEFRVIAEMMKEQYDKSIPVKRVFHLPFFEYETDVSKDNFYDAAMISSARCARTSYYNHENKKTLPSEDFELSKRLVRDKHFSPFEFPVIDRFEAEELFTNIKWFEFVEQGRWWKKVELKEITTTSGLPLTIRNDMSGNLNNWKVVQFRKIIERMET